MYFCNRQKRDFMCLFRCIYLKQCVGGGDFKPARSAGKCTTELLQKVQQQHQKEKVLCVLSWFMFWIIPYETLENWTKWITVNKTIFWSKPIGHSIPPAMHWVFQWNYQSKGAHQWM